MARIRTTAKLATPTSSEALQRDEITSNIALISEVMRASIALKSKNDSKDTTGKPSEIMEEEYEVSQQSQVTLMGRSILKDEDLKAMNGLGYFVDKYKVRLAGNEMTLKLKTMNEF
jgi:hypothetical protein